jgi:hypothetical protein
MPDYFLDTSALAKHYHQEVGTDVIDKVLQSSTSFFFISRLTTLELHSVFAPAPHFPRVSAGGLASHSLSASTVG